MYRHSRRTERVLAALVVGALSVAPAVGLAGTAQADTGPVHFDDQRWAAQGGAPSLDDGHDSVVLGVGGNNDSIQSAVLSIPAADPGTWYDQTDIGYGLCNKSSLDGGSYLWNDTRFSFGLQELGGAYTSRLDVIVRDLSHPNSHTGQYPESIAATFGDPPGTGFRDLIPSAQNNPDGLLQQGHPGLDAPMVEQVDLTHWQGDNIQIILRMDNGSPAGDWFGLFNPDLTTGLSGSGGADGTPAYFATHYYNANPVLGNDSCAAYNLPWERGDYGETVPSGWLTRNSGNPLSGSVDWGSLLKSLLIFGGAAASSLERHNLPGAAPQGLAVHSAMVGGRLGNQLNWGPYAPGTGMGSAPANVSVSYNVYRDGAQVGVGLDSASFTDTTVDLGSDHTYTVSAVLNGVESAQSQSVKAWALQATGGGLGGGGGATPPGGPTGGGVHRIM